MDQITIQRILEIETDALSAVKTAKDKARSLVQQAESAAQTRTDEIIGLAKQQAAKITAESAEQAESTRRFILKQAEEQANDVQRTAAGNIPNAVTYILDHVIP